MTIGGVERPRNRGSSLGEGKPYFISPKILLLRRDYPAAYPMDPDGSTPEYADYSHISRVDVKSKWLYNPPSTCLHALHRDKQSRHLYLQKDATEFSRLSGVLGGGGGGTRTIGKKKDVRKHILY